MLLNALEEILHTYDESSAVERYELTRDEFLFLYGCSKGHDYVDLMDYLDRQKSYIYRVRNQLIKKFNAKTFEEVMYLFGQLDHEN